MCSQIYVSQGLFVLNKTYVDRKFICKQIKTLLKTFLDFVLTKKVSDAKSERSSDNDDEDSGQDHVQVLVSHVSVRSPFDNLENDSKVSKFWFESVSWFAGL